ncbi:MAG TPA: hydroxymethylglutaryl-CoA lyase [Gaiellaceae bacterium]|nr:hydroxymethylglutaryl-CoA lyase [Gaiellaceae bacterium]
MSGTGTDVTVVEVGPRDGLQSVRQTMPTAAKCRWIDSLAAAGLRQIQVGSFVSRRALPQMADCADLVAHALLVPELRISVLAPNLRYAQRAFEAGVHAVTIPVSVSEPHSLANVRMTHEAVLAEVRAIVALRDTRHPGTQVEVGLATAFGCTIQGAVPEDDVLRLAVRVAACGVESIHPADTVGFAGPAQIRRLLPRLRAELGEACSGVHLHDTRGQGLANVVAALDVGVRSFDSSHAGLGGCPYAPGATGNVVTEDLVFLLESMGLRTGVDVERLVAARAVLAAGLPGVELHGRLAAAGLPKGFAAATAAA